MISLSAYQVAWAAQIACLLEVNAWKPGNVTRLQYFPDCRFEDFLVSAVAIGPAFLEATYKPVGMTILRAVRDTQRLVDTNTNLGMVLLLAPREGRWIGPFQRTASGRNSGVGRADR